MAEVGPTREIQHGGTRGQKTIDSSTKSTVFCNSLCPPGSKLIRSSFMQRRNITRRPQAYICVNLMKTRKATDRQKYMQNGLLRSSSAPPPETPRHATPKLLNGFPHLQKTRRKQLRNSMRNNCGNRTASRRSRPQKTWNHPLCAYE